MVSPLSWFLLWKWKRSAVTSGFDERCFWTTISAKESSDSLFGAHKFRSNPCVLFPRMLKITATCFDIVGAEELFYAFGISIPVIVHFVKGFYFPNRQHGGCSISLFYSNPILVAKFVVFRCKYSRYWFHSIAFNPPTEWSLCRLTWAHGMGMCITHMLNCCPICRA